MTNKAIADYAMLSDRHSAALVARDGSVDWLCVPRFDSPSVFAALLDDRGGSWSIRPAGDFTVSRRYIGVTLVLETVFETATGTVVVTDALLIGDGPDVHRLGADAPHVLARVVSCPRGSVDVEIRYTPRPAYAMVAPLLSRVRGGVRARGGPQQLVLSSPVELEITGQEASAVVPMSECMTLRFALHGARVGDPAPRVWSDGEIAGWLAATEVAWQNWSDAHQRYHGPYRGLVSHSGRVLQALTYQPTGAVVAAPTTSLPEAPGGDRNWDYRYSWVRDASFTLNALWVAACPDEADEFLSFMTTAAATYSPERALQIVVGIRAGRDLTERELPHLSGWRGSAPVRVGNDAWRQVQVDVYGELLDAVHRLSGQISEFEPEARTFLVALADAAVRKWREPDHGIWEVRGAPRHFLHSKLMCWVAADRAVALADRLRAQDRVPAWTAAREEMRAAILTEGWSDVAGAYTQTFGSTALDASALMMPIVGFLPACDPRMTSTIDAIASRLTDRHGLVYRYRVDDGLEGNEGAFLLCTFWLAQALAMAGRVAEAHEVFRRATAFVNDVGLMAEEVCPRTGDLLGNFPQAFSHIGLVNAAWAIAEAESSGVLIPPC
ncbi:glycoside hydrolase family 15 protein [Sphaerisporangium aureirubrum]|uniref:Glycoside hydrolase family 15 protein n=1 Tax=Sphaerisporangium aureirubrum TaxID=1544736 RepID=A0ABW1NM22_9ACTN